MTDKSKTIKIAVSNQKGGCGKTTTVINLGAALSALGSRVLLVDFDPQCHLSKWLGYEPHGEPTSTDLIYNNIAKLPFDLNGCIQHCEEGFDYIPSSPLLAGMLGILATDSDSSNVVTRIFNNDFFTMYDFVIFDCQTALDLLVTNVLKCCDKLLIPVQADLLAYEGVPQMIQTLTRIKGDMDISKYLLGFLVTMFVTNTIHSMQILRGLKESYGNLVFDTVISNRTEAKNAVGLHCSSVSDSNSKVGHQYLEVARAVLEVLNNEK